MGEQLMEPEKVYDKTRPIASYRRRRVKIRSDQQEPPPSPSAEPQEQPYLVRTTNHDDSTGSDDDSSESEEEHSAPPVDVSDMCLLPSPSLLPSFRTHVAYYIWSGTERGVLKCHSHISKLLSWKIDTDVEDRSWKSLFKKSGLLWVRSCSYKTPSKNLIAAFVERWHPETNSFHFPFGEMTITLDDVHCLTGLSVVGLPVQSNRLECTPGDKDVMNLLGIGKRQIKKAVGGKRGSSIKLPWLRKTYMKNMTSEDENDVLYAARAYVMYTFGCSIFADKSGDRVPTAWLEYLEDMGGIHEYAWGAATLAYLYRQLGLASRFKTAQMAGYLTLLEAWIYEHFPSLRPPRNMDFQSPKPLSLRWAPEGHCGATLTRVKITLGRHVSSNTSRRTPNAHV
ncbi:hypothetical protein ACS0TY_006383 [Phlomoides rotata]